MDLIRTIRGLPAVTLEGQLNEKLRQIYFDRTLARLRVFELQLLLLSTQTVSTFNSKDKTLEE